MLTSQRLTVKASELRQKLGDLAAQDDSTVEDIEQARSELTSTETRMRAALEAEGVENRVVDGNDSEHREVESIRQRASLGGFLESRIRGRMVDGAEEEYRAAVGASYGAIPLGMFEPRKRAVTAAPTSGTPVNLEGVVPYVFSSSLAPVLGIEMRVSAPGTFAVPRITTPPGVGTGPVATAATTNETAGVMDVVTTTPRRLPASVRTNYESIWMLGQEYEDAIRESLRMQWAVALDDQIINGAAAAPAMNGLMTQIGLPSAAQSAVTAWDDAVGYFSDNVDGLWSFGIGDVFGVTHPTGYKFANKLFREPEIVGTGMSRAGATAGELSAVDYINSRAAGIQASVRMPGEITSGTLNNHVPILFALRGRPDVTTAVIPTYGEVTVDDPYTDASKGERIYTFVAGTGALVLIHSAAYKVDAIRLS